MLKLVLIDVAVCAALIMVAACAMVLRWRRRRRRLLVRQARRGTATGPYGGRAARREAPLVPGFSAGSEAQDPAMAVPAERNRLAASRAGQRSTSRARQRSTSGRANPGPASGWPTPGQAPREVSHEPGPREPSLNPGPGELTPNLAPGEPSPEPGPAKPAGEPGRPATGPLTSTEKIGNYYADADQAMSDYLIERGWPKEPDTPGADGS
jgi:hypothetical protein